MPAFAPPKPNTGQDYIFDVTAFPYNAVGDDSTSNTTRIQAAFDAAAVASALGDRPVVFIPEGKFKVGAGITAGNYALNLNGSNIHVKGPGILKLANGSSADAVLNVPGEYNEIREITIDGNAAGSPGGRGDCFYLGGNYNTARGVQCRNSKTGTGIDFLIVDSSKHNKWINCISKNAGYNGFDNRGDYTTLRDCEAYEWGVHGFNQAGGIREQVTIDGFYAESTKATTHSGLIIDPGPGNYIKQATVANVRIRNIPNSIAFVKVARIHDLLIDRMWVYHTEAISTIKIVEGCRTIKIRDSYFSRAIDFDEGAGVTGSATITSASGFCRFTTTSHGLTVGDVVYVVSSIAGHNGVHQVLSATTNTFDTEVRFAGADTANWYQCQGEVILDTVKVGEAGTAHANFKVSGLRTPRFTMHHCELWGCNTKAVAPKNSYPITAVELYDLQDNFFEFNRPAAGGNDSYVLIGETNGVDFFTTSRKLKWVNNSYRNRLDGTVEVLLNLDARILATCIDGGRDYIVNIDPTTVSGSSYNNVTWQVGDRFWKQTPTGYVIGWICTVAGTLSGTSVFEPFKNLNESGEFDVTLSPYNAKGDDTTDDTAALQSAFDDAKTYSLLNTNNYAKIIMPPRIYRFTTLTIQNVRLNVVAQGAVLKALSGNSANQSIWIKGDTDGGTADYINWYGLKVDANYPTATTSGSGIGFNIRGDHQYFSEVECANTKDATFVAAQLWTRFSKCISRNSGRTAYRLRGDFHRITDCQAYDWNRANTLGNRAILCDSQEMDVEEVFINNFFGHISTPTWVTDCILLDCGDGHLDGTNTVKCGVATNVNGKATWTIEAGHGFAPGDAIRIQDSDVAQYDGYLTTGTAQAGGASTITLATSASSNNNLYNGFRISITAGTGAGQVRTISAYVGTTRVATVSTPWGVQPDATSVYYVHSDGKDHKIISVTGEVFIYVVDANTIRLYKNKNDALRQAGGATGRYVLSSNGTGTLYIKSFGSKRKSFTVSSQANGEITCNAHGFTTGRAARLSVAVAATDALPTGLTALIKTNTPYVSAGVSTTNYWRRKRIKNVTARNITIHKNYPTNDDSAVMKVNNTHNLLIDRLVCGQAPEDGTNSDLCLRIGAGNRKVHITNCVLPNGFVNNTKSMIPDLEIDHCELGTEEYIPIDAIVEIQANKMSLHHNMFRFSHAAINLPSTVTDLQDRDIDFWEIYNNIFEARNATSQCRVFDISFSDHIARSGLIKFYNNVRRNAGSGEAPYVGASFTAATNDTVSSTAHCLSTGDEVYVYSEGTLPTPLAINTPYYVRRTGDSTMTLHTDKAGASNDTNRVDITDTGSLTGGQLHRMLSPKIGCTLAFSTPRDRGLLQRGSSGREFEGVTVPTNASFAFQAGDIMWNMNPATSSSVLGVAGWICSKTGVEGTTAATFASMPTLT